jgi:uncharacterized protein
MGVFQSIRNPTGLNAYGSALIRVEPDHGSLRFAVTRLEREPAKAFAKAREGSQAVAAFLRTAGIADGDVAASAVTLNQEIQFQGQERKFVGYRARVGYHVLLRDLGKLEPVLVGAVDAGADVVESVQLRTRKMREVRAEARRMAMRAARAKAEVLAGEAGTHLGAVLHIEDVDAEGQGRRGSSHYPADVDLTEAAEEAEEVRAWNPGHITVAAAVMVTWALLP